MLTDPRQQASVDAVFAGTWERSAATAPWDVVLFIFRMGVGLALPPAQRGLADPELRATVATIVEHQLHRLIPVLRVKS